MLEASMVVIGDEILGGYVTDTNSPWLAARLAAHGVPLSRVQVVPDEPQAIGEALHTELARSRPRLVVTSGGIGSTPDDLTYEAVAASLGLALEEHPHISERLDRVLDWSRDQGLDVSEAFAWHLKRMARVPAGGQLLVRDGGWVPAVVVPVDGGLDEPGGAAVAILPGVPSEFRAILGEVVEPELIRGRNTPPTVVEVEHGFPESALNLTFAEVLERFPSVKLGSYPGRPMLVRLSGPDGEVAAAEQLVRQALAALEAGPAGPRLAAAWGQRTAERRSQDRRDEGTEEDA